MSMHAYLEFERPIAEVEGKIEFEIGVHTVSLVSGSEGAEAGWRKSRYSGIFPSGGSIFVP